MKDPDSERKVVKYSKLFLTLSDKNRTNLDRDNQSNNI